MGGGFLWTWAAVISVHALVFLVSGFAGLLPHPEQVRALMADNFTNWSAAIAGCFDAAADRLPPDADARADMARVADLATEVRAELLET